MTGSEIEDEGREGPARLADELRRESEARRRAEALLGRTLAENERLREELGSHGAGRQTTAGIYDDEVFIGRSPAIRGLRRRFEELAAGDDDVLVLGELGSGKKLVAAPSTAGAFAAAGRWSRSTARRCPRPCSRASSSAT